MTNKQKDIVNCVLTLSVLFLYFLGVRQWKVAELSEVPEKVAVGKHIYFICFSSALYMATFVLFLFAQPNWLKAITSTVNAACAVIVYQEVRYGDAQWSEWSYWIIFVMAANYMLLYMIIEKLKKKKNGNNTPHR